jgi:PPOX class probable F420-dependent enzyme
MRDRERFLSGRYIATLATENDDGSSHLTAVWFLYEGGAFFVPTGSATRKARNVAERGRAAVMVDARTRGELQGISASGAADLLTGEEALRLNARIHRRYLTENGLQDPGLGQPITSSDNVTVRLRPERWNSWDMSEFFGDLFASPDLVYPLNG